MSLILLLLFYYGTFLKDSTCKRRRLIRSLSPYFQTSARILYWSIPKVGVVTTLRDQHLRYYLRACFTTNALEVMSHMQFSDYSFQIIPRQVFHPDNCSDHPLISTFLMSNCGGPGQNPTHFRTKERELKHEVLFGSRGLSIVLQFSFFHSSNSEVVKDLPSYWYSSISFPVQPWLLGSGVLSDRTPRGEEAWMSKPLKDQLSYNRPSNHRLRTWSCFSSSYKVLSLICDCHEEIYPQIHSFINMYYMYTMTVYISHPYLSTILQTRIFKIYLTSQILYPLGIISRPKRSVLPKTFPIAVILDFSFSHPFLLIWSITNYSWFYL